MFIHALPVNETQTLSAVDKRRLETLFTQKTTNRLESITQHVKTPLLLGLCFALLGTQWTDMAVFKAVPRAEKYTLSYNIIKIVLFVIIVYIYINK